MIAQESNSFTKSSNTLKRNHGEIDAGSVGMHKNNCDQGSNFENKDGSKRLMMSAPDDDQNANRGNSSIGINAMKVSLVIYLHTHFIYECLKTFDFKTLTIFHSIDLVERA